MSRSSPYNTLPLPPGLASIIPSVRVLPPILLSLVFGLAFGTVFVFLPTYATQIGPFYVAYSATAIDIRLVCGRLSDRVGRRLMILPALLLMGSGTLSLAWLGAPVGLVLAGALIGMAHGLLYPALSAYVIDLARALGTFSAAVLLGSALGSFVFGVVAERLGYRAIYLAGSGIVMATFVAFQRYGKQTEEAIKQPE